MEQYEPAPHKSELISAHTAAPFVGPDAPREATRPLDERLAELRRVRIHRRLFGIALLASDVAAGFLALLLGQILRSGTVDARSAAAILAAAFPVYFLAALQTGAHSPSNVHKPATCIFNAVFAFAGTCAIFFLGAFFINLDQETSRLYVAQTMMLCLLLGVSMRYVISLRARRELLPKPFADLCIYDDITMTVKNRKGAITASEAGLVLNFSEPAMIERLGQLALGMDRIIVHCSPGRREAWSRALKCLDIRSELVTPELTDLRPLGTRYRSGEVSLVLANGPLYWHQRVTKKLFDRVFGLMALLALAPLMIVVAIAIKLESRGPVFFRQERIGLGNRLFKIWKFRSMRTDMQDIDASKLTERDDPRVTRVGRFIRRTSIDELPQLLNVMAGQMSLVGPRPHALKARAGSSLYWEVDTAYWHRHSVKPGITGLAQIRGHRGNTFREDDLQNRLQADLEYVANWSLVGDLRILLRTVTVIFHKNAF